jgi:hypothetical protein
MNNIHVDLMSQGQGVGEVVDFLQANGKIEPNVMRPWVHPDTRRKYITVLKKTGLDPTVQKNYKAVQVNVGTLRPMEWKELDEGVLSVTRERLSGFDYLIGKGLVKNLPNAMGTTVLEWHSASDSQEAILSMDAVTRSLGDRTVFKQHFLPIPIIHADYEINSRVLAVARNSGNGIDTSEAEHAARRIMEKKEDMLFTDVTYSFGDKGDNGRNSIYSLVNYPDRNPVVMSLAWDDSAKTAAEIVNDVVRMKDASIAARHYGPFTLFIPTLYDSILDQDYSTSGASIMTIRERIMKLDQVNEIKVVDRLAADNVLLVQLTPNVIRIINGMPLQNIEWTTEGTMIHKYKVLTIQVPQIRSDYDGRCGITHLVA